jgi:hypothetical protein
LQPLAQGCILPASREEAPVPDRGLGAHMILDGNRLAIADEQGVTVVELSEDATRGTVVAQMRDPTCHDATAVARVEDRYFVVNAGWNDPPPYTISSVPVPA